MDLCSLRFAVEVLQKQLHTQPFGESGGMGEARNRGLLPNSHIRCEMVAPVYNNPLRLQASGKREVGYEVRVGRLSQVRRDFSERVWSARETSNLEHASCTHMQRASSKLSSALGNIGLHIYRPYAVLRKPTRSAVFFQCQCR